MNFIRPQLFVAVLVSVSVAISAHEYDPFCDRANGTMWLDYKGFLLYCDKSDNDRGRTRVSDCPKGIKSIGFIDNCVSTEEGIGMRHELCLKHFQYRLPCSEPLLTIRNEFLACHTGNRSLLDGTTWTWNTDYAGSIARRKGAFKIECKYIDKKIKATAVACLDGAGNIKKHGDEWTESISCPRKSFLKRCEINSQGGQIKTVGCVDPETKTTYGTPGEPVRWTNKAKKELYACHIWESFAETSTYRQISVLLDGGEIIGDNLMSIVNGSGSAVACIAPTGERLLNGGIWNSTFAYYRCSVASDSSTAKLEIAGCIDMNDGQQQSHGAEWWEGTVFVKCDIEAKKQRFRQLAGCLTLNNARVEPSQEFNDLSNVRVCKIASVFDKVFHMSPAVACLDGQGRRVENGSTFPISEGVMVRCEINSEGEDKSKAIGCIDIANGEVVQFGLGEKRTVGGFGMDCTTPYEGATAVDVAGLRITCDSEDAIYQTPTGLKLECMKTEHLQSSDEILTRHRPRVVGCVINDTVVAENETVWSEVQGETRVVLQCEFTEIYNDTTQEHAISGGFSAVECVIDSVNVPVGCYLRGNAKLAYCRQNSAYDASQAFGESIDDTAANLIFVKNVLGLELCEMISSTDTEVQSSTQAPGISTTVRPVKKRNRRGTVYTSTTTGTTSSIPKATISTISEEEEETIIEVR